MPLCHRIASRLHGIDEGIGRRVELSLDFGIRLAGSFWQIPELVE